MGGVVDMVTGKSARKQAKMARQAQDEQKAALDKQERRVAAVEEGQRKMRAGGGRGLLAYIEDDLGSSLSGSV